MLLTVQNISAFWLSTDIGLLAPGDSKSTTMTPERAYRAADNLKSMVDLGRVVVTVADEAGRLDSLEPALQSTGMQALDVTILPAAMLTLNATPVTLIPAPGAGLMLIFEGAHLSMTYGSAAYAGIAAGEDLAIKYTGTGGLQVGSCETTGFLDQTSNQLRFVRPYAAASLVSDITPVANAPLVLHMLTGEIITGNSPLKLRVFFRLLPSLL